MATNLLTNGSVTIPADFCGLHIAYPGVYNSVAYPTPLAGVNIANVRSNGYQNPAGTAYLRWSDIETSSGVYDWSNLDYALTAWRTQGYSVSFVIYGTPSFYTSFTYNNPLCAYPDLDTTLSHLTAFVSLLITRYNTSSGAWFTANNTGVGNLGKGIQVIMPLNEPHFNNATFTGTLTSGKQLTVVNPTGFITINTDGSQQVQGADVPTNTCITSFISGTNGYAGIYGTSAGANVGPESMTAVSAAANFFYGTYAQAVDFCQAVYATSKALDVAIIVASPSFVDPIQGAIGFAKSTGTLNPTVYGYQTFDVLDFHTYWAGPYGQPYGVFVNDMMAGPVGIQAYQYVSNKYCSGKPLSISEFGFDAAIDQGLQSLLLEPASFRYTYFGRCLLLAAAMGIQKVICFRQVESLCGLWQASGSYAPYVADTNGVILAFNTIAAIQGKTIVAATAQCGGAVSVHFSDTTSLTI